jgi:hypothetical protein
MGRRAAILVRRLRLAWLWLALGGLAVVLIDAILLALIGGPDWHATPAGVVLAIAAMVPAGACFGLLACAVMARGRVWEFMLAAMAALLAAMAGWAVLIARAASEDRLENVLPLKLALTATVLGAGLPLLGHLLTHPDRRRALVALRRALGIWLIAGLASLLLFMWSVWWQSRWIALAVVAALATLGAAASGLALVACTARLRAWARTRETLPRTLHLTLTCPACGLEQSLPQGPVRCGRCDCAMVIAIEEPRCACGYLLYRLQGDQCPECGRPAAAPAAPP